MAKGNVGKVPLTSILLCQCPNRLIPTLIDYQSWDIQIDKSNRFSPPILCHIMTLVKPLWIPIAKPLWPLMLASTC